MGKLKKIIAILATVIVVLCLIMIPIIFLHGCAAAPTSEANALPEPTFTEFSDELGFKFIFDNNTHIVYIFKDGSYDGGISPYYLLDENDVPHMVKWENNEFVLLPNS